MGGGRVREAGGIVLTPRARNVGSWNSTTLNRSHYLAAKAHGCQAFQATPDWFDGIVELMPQQLEVTNLDNVYNLYNFNNLTNSFTLYIL